ncbi:hypothetical protein M409DRAFT_20659 [Zasmidium cellare ATCC 36951]|uniref:RNase III domain-containing protein n=1 Tax=Zasmidium cellare ATCC 36951 TaxID=1080233 RepID=A0A6A6CTF3_ZASCE|nr:uncharacterized protein M409DRAFT_20659 [Zasmidium cellare ATCC 36951]KAF2169440.1 hypothetical protein M409DRAFT_20659 [Zasmidium cellare ATCC 36951]
MSTKRDGLKLCASTDCTASCKLTLGNFTHTFAHPELLKEALTVPIAYLPSNMQGRPTLRKDGKKLAFLGDSALKTIMATSWAAVDGQDSLFWTTHFDNGIGKDSFLGRLGDAIGILHHLVAADGDRMTAEFWEQPPLNPNKNPKQKTKLVNEKNKPVPSAMEALLGAIWTDCLRGEPRREPVQRVKAFLWHLGVSWPRDEEEREAVKEMIDMADEVTKEKNEIAAKEAGMGEEGSGQAAAEGGS